ncbi:MAG TPA: 4-hydroxy-3-methylbut-2-enyl diphosphate reductase [bacterium]|uniref:4-hydroxy-3-methylbut-2-enyl diphosphate reductase n=1 Tax=candidate division TA06 bacterium ADurb.Bin417 TaxID=1852828 RepID=A0A1V5MGD7_UNCT6|nr:MAG: 4-hydroxy-3-methylbut-2-enyl diphosphate reductase [candidate division TA06 bacterium ADurb.Bin417]HNQ34857.1 4-hydroxy-3-methylbut-2-enyl diphosphate reductase [bacterium]HNS48721.1 4-hydroxy-3-methylbut-2-enyl diphosphate reductase [bacterium]
MARVLTAREIGFCFGVKRAVSLCEETLRRHGACFSIGPVIHNERVMENLTARGLKIVREMPDGRTPALVRSHGLHPEKLRALSKSGREVVDATCPFVSRVQKLVTRLRRQGYRVLIIGEPDHPEVKALAGFAGNSALICPAGRSAARRWAAVNFRTPPAKRVAVVSQTTSTEPVYRETLAALLKAGLPGETRIFDTVCRVTEKRQAEALELAGKTDLLLVVGSRKSANTRNLYRLVRKRKPAAYFISGPEEVRDDWCRPNLTVGLVSGTSTPVETIKEIKKKIERT